MRKALPWLSGTLIITLLSFVSISHSLKVKAATADHIVISEIQLSGGTGASTKEFVELYNPTNSSVNLENWKLSKKNQPGTTEDFLISTASGTIPSHGFFLIASEDYNIGATVSADLTYNTVNASLTDNNTIVLYDSTSTVIDKLGLGNAVDFEGTTETNPSSGTSRERIANSSSTITSMAIGGIDEFLGNSEDSDNNANDFLSRSTPQPQNTTSSQEPSSSPTPIPTPTNTPSATETPTSAPTSTPTITSTPSLTPSSTPTTTPSNTPTASPTMTVTPTPSPTSLATPSTFPSPTSTTFPLFPFGRYTCKVNYVQLHSFWFTIFIPQIFCGFNM